MGGRFSCVDGNTTLHRIQYDLTPIKVKAPPIIWLIGPPGSGRRTQGELLNENLGFANIKVTQLLRDEATIETGRGKIVNEAIKNRSKKIPDTVVIDLIKESMLRNVNTKGYVINNFPKSPKQAEIFIKEIGEVDLILYLHSDMSLLVERVQQKVNGRINNDTIRRKIEHCNRDIKECLAKYGSKIQRINTNDNSTDVFDQILEVIGDKFNMKPVAVVSETEYSQN